MNVPDTTISVLKMIKENAFIGKKEKKVVKDIKQEIVTKHYLERLKTGGDRKSSEEQKIEQKNSYPI